MDNFQHFSVCWRYAVVCAMQGSFFMILICVLWDAAQCTTLFTAAPGLSIEVLF